MLRPIPLIDLGGMMVVDVERLQTLSRPQGGTWTVGPNPLASRQKPTLTVSRVLPLRGTALAFHTTHRTCC